MALRFLFVIMNADMYMGRLYRIVWVSILVHNNGVRVIYDQHMGTPMHHCV